jgi:hypothetical protein
MENGAIQPGVLRDDQTAYPLTWLACFRSARRPFPMDRRRMDLAHSTSPSTITEEVGAQRGPMGEGLCNRDVSCRFKGRVLAL